MMPILPFRQAVLLSLVLITPLTLATPLQDSGVLYVQGTLTESACRLEMSSANQSIDMGNLTTGALRNPGDRGTPVAVELRLEDCLRSPGYLRDAKRGTLSWGGNEPVVAVRFLAPSDTADPNLVQVVGAKGLALAISDNARRRIRLGERTAPVLLSARNNSLTYYIIPQRTPAPLMPGAWQAVINFNLLYY